MKKSTATFALCSAILISTNARAQQHNCNIAQSPDGGFVMTCVPSTTPTPVTPTTPTAPPPSINFNVHVIPGPAIDIEIYVFSDSMINKKIAKVASSQGTVKLWNQYFDKHVHVHMNGNIVPEALTITYADGTSENLLVSK